MQKDKDGVIIISEMEIQHHQEAHNITPLRPVNMAAYRSIPLEEMIQEKLAPIEYVFYPCLPTQGIGWIYAAAGMGKTMFTLNLAYAIASGGKFMNYICPKPRKVLYVDGEMAYNQLQSRVITIKEHHGDMEIPGNLHFLTADKILPARIPKMDEPEGQYIYERKMIEEEFEVIIFDNCSALSTIDQLKGSEWKKITDWQLKLRSMGKTIINIHHSGKDVTSFRGASDMMDTADFAISLQPINENALEEDIVTCKKIKVVYSKNRSFSGYEALPFEATFTQGIWTCRSMEKSEMEMIVDMVALKMTQRDIAHDTSLSLAKVNRLIKKARQLRLIRDE